jgi:hypothetical protein
VVEVEDKKGAPVTLRERLVHLPEMRADCIGRDG